MLARRGAGYWRWKPWIILDAFGRAREGDLIFYTDAAMEMIADPAPLFALAAGRPIVLFEHARGPDGAASHPMSVWTKRDCFVLMDADEPRFHDAQQLLGGFQLYRVCDASREFLRRLAEEMMDDRKVSDLPNVSGLPNLPGFREHRHDQSIRCSTGFARSPIPAITTKRGSPCFGITASAAASTSEACSIGSARQLVRGQPVTGPCRSSLHGIPCIGALGREEVWLLRAREQGLSTAVLKLPVRSWAIGFPSTTASVSGRN